MKKLDPVMRQRLAARAGIAQQFRARGSFWGIRQDAKRENVLQLYIYGDVEGDGWDWWTGEKVESDTSAEHFRQVLAEWPDVETIEIYINSYGGEVFEGTAIYNQLKRHKARKLVFVDGFACSIASVIAMAGDEVVMPRNTMMMIHNMWMCACGNARELRKAADDLDVINAAGRQAYLQKAGDKLSEEELVRLMDEASWLSAEDCVRLGLADRFADEDADLDEAAAGLAGVERDLQERLQRMRGIAAAIREMTDGTENGPVQQEQPEETEEPEADAEADAPEQTEEPEVSEQPEEPEQKEQNRLMAFLQRV